jgi:hypothetical protein
MMIDELVHTCAHEDVARAAVFSLGFPYVGKVASAVQFHDETIGAFVAKAVCRFAATAKEDDRRSLLAEMDGKDQPLLAGLRFILTPVLEEEVRAIGHAAAAHALGRSAAVHAEA